jgi:hypothetical protein
MLIEIIFLASRDLGGFSFYRLLPSTLHKLIRQFIFFQSNEFTEQLLRNQIITFTYIFH